MGFSHLIQLVGVLFLFSTVEAYTRYASLPFLFRIPLVTQSISFLGYYLTGYLLGQFLPGINMLVLSLIFLLAVLATAFAFIFHPIPSP